MTINKKNNYRILKLRSGADVIANIVGGSKKTVVVHKPMEMKVASFISPDGQDRKNILCMKDWLEYTNKSEISIPKDWIAFFLNPDEDVIKLYEIEKKRMESGPIAPREIGLQEEFEEEELANDEEDSIMDRMKIDPNSIIASFAIPPGIFMAMIAQGLLSSQHESSEGEELSDEFLESLFSDINEINMRNHNNIEEEDDDELGFGNRWKDWSPDPDDYTSDGQNI
tara:strand:- start:636 stop:1313 length:678 start_codon:yes stop_codon:yes gene_type:complete